MRWTKRTRNDVGDAYAGGLKKIEECIDSCGESGVCNYRDDGSLIWLATPSCNIKYTGEI
jgi:hypothetical protein